MNEIQLTGGARIGMANATIPLATLKVNKERLELNSAVGNLIFRPKDVVFIEPYTLIPIIGQGIKINHNVSFYNTKVIFWSFKSPETIVSQIRKTGFLTLGTSHSPKTDKELFSLFEMQSLRSFPIKKNALLIALISWSALLLMDLALHLMDGTNHPLPVGKGILIGLALLFLSALASLISTDFRNLILIKGKDRNDIKTTAIFILCICGCMLATLGMLIRPFGN